MLPVHEGRGVLNCCFVELAISSVVGESGVVSVLKSSKLQACTASSGRSVLLRSSAMLAVNNWFTES